MNRLAVHFLVLSLTVAALGGGCKKKADTQAGADAGAKQAAQALPGGAEVTAALDKKDYDEALAALTKVKQAITTDDQRVQYMVLANEVKQKLLEASATDPKAADALTALRAISSGR